MTLNKKTGKLSFGILVYSQTLCKRNLSRRKEHVAKPMSRHHAPASSFSVSNSQYMTDNSDLGLPCHKVIIKLFNDTLIRNNKNYSENEYLGVLYTPISLK